MSVTEFENELEIHLPFSSFDNEIITELARNLFYLYVQTNNPEFSDLLTLIIESEDDFLNIYEI